MVDFKGNRFSGLLQFCENRCKTAKFDASGDWSPRAGYAGSGGRSTGRMEAAYLSVIPAKAGIHSLLRSFSCRSDPHRDPHRDPLRACPKSFQTPLFASANPPRRKNLSEAMEGRFFGLSFSGLTGESRAFDFLWKTIGLPDQVGQ